MGQRFERWVRAYAETVIRFRLWVIVGVLVLAGLAASGGQYLAFSTDYRVFFSNENPELVAFEDFQKTYTKNDNILFVIQPKERKVFTPQMAEAIEWLTAESWKIPYAIRVDSISNFQHTWANGDELTVEDLIQDGKDYSAQKFDERRAVALAEPLLRGNLISPDADTTGINVTIQYPGKAITEVPEAVAVARDLVAQLQAKYPDLTIVLSGVSMLNNAFGEAGQSDAATLTPLMYLILILMLAITLRSVSATFVTVLVIGLSTLVAMGLAGHMQTKLTPISVTAPTIILTLAIADSIHILVSMLGLMREGHDKLDALKESIRINFMPVSITSLTTIVGFLSLNFSDAPPFWHLGNITAAGIAAAWLFSLLFLPATLSLLPVKAPKKGGIIPFAQKRMERLGEFVIAKRKPVLVISGLISIILISLVPKINLNDQFVRYFDESIEFRNHALFAEQNLTGIYIIEYSMPSGGEGQISEPAYLNSLQDFTGWLRQQPEVMHVYSYSDIIKRLNKNMHADQQEYYRIPEQRDLAAQYLFLYEISLPYGLDLNDRINIDKSATRISVTLREISTVEIRQFLARSKQWLGNNVQPKMQATPTGATVMFSYISQRNIESMLKGNLLAVMMIAVILMITLRSFGLGVLSLIPNLVPILATFGVWALLVGQVGMAAATVTATSLGIVVDDTVHFLAKYLRARREKGLSRSDSIRYAFSVVGTAIVMTTVILSIGFGVLAASTFMVNAQMGLLTAIAIILALVVDFLLLPALLLIGEKPEQEEKNEVPENIRQVA